jgi:putative salt-induced outer membrane protein
LKEITMCRFHFVIALIILSVGSCFADQVTLSNGDHLTGSVVKSDGKTLTLKTELAGTIEIKWSGVKEIVSDTPLVVTTSAADAKPIEGTVTTKDDSLVVASSTAGTVNVPKAEVASLRSPTDQVAYEKSLHPSLFNGWNGGVNLGFALTGGNSQTTNLAVAFLANRPTSTDKLSLYFNQVNSKNNAPGAVPSTTANNIMGGARYDRNITSRLFAFVNGDFMSDSLQSLDLRSVLGGGLGFHAIKAESTTLDFLGGGNYTREKYTALTRNFAALTLGEELMHKVRLSTVLTQKFNFYPNLSNTGQYRAAFDLGTVTKLSKWLGWQNAFSDIYVSDPPLGKKKNDIVLTTGINVSFTH